MNALGQKGSALGLLYLFFTQRRSNVTFPETIHQHAGKDQRNQSMLSTHEVREISSQWLVLCEENLKHVINIFFSTQTIRAINF